MNDYQKKVIFFLLKSSIHRAGGSPWSPCRGPSRLSFPGIAWEPKFCEEREGTGKILRKKLGQQKNKKADNGNRNPFQL